MKDIHPVADLFPMMDDSDYATLRDSIDRCGQSQPITIWRGQILDGRNRKRACEELGIEPHYEEFFGSEDAAISLAVSLNLHRRHLTASQRAVIALAVEPLYAAAAKRAQQASGGANPGKKAVTPDPGEPVRHTKEAAAQAARATGASRTLVNEAKTLARSDPEALERVRRGESTLSRESAKDRPTKSLTQQLFQILGRMDDEERTNAIEQIHDMYWSQS